MMPELQPRLGTAPAWLCVMLLAGSCATAPPEQVRHCASEGLLVDAMFAGGNFANCRIGNERADGRTVNVTIRPEDPPPINRSPWYAFRISSTDPRPVTVNVDFIDGYARYWPKISRDGKRWTRARDGDVRFADDDTSLTVIVTPQGPPVFVSAQEVVVQDYYTEWVHDMAAKSFVTTKLLGRSVEGRPIHVVQTASRKESVFLFGRQHPPEVSGALAMRAFVDTVLGDTELAERFRERYTVIIVPLINPDGTERGHWRHNVNGVDLNRDWGPFSQPETQGAWAMLQSLEAAGVRPALMLDFHSTRESLFYTQLAEETSWTVDFATEWFDRFRAREPGFQFKHDARPRSEQPNTKNFFFDRYRIPAITYEIGDEEERAAIARTTPVFAEEMMRVLLEYSGAEQTANRDNPVANEGRPVPVPLP